MRDGLVFPFSDQHKRMREERTRWEELGEEQVKYVSAICRLDEESMTIKRGEGGHLLAPSSLDNHEPGRRRGQELEAGSTSQDLGGVDGGERRGSALEGGATNHVNAWFRERR